MKKYVRKGGEPTNAKLTDAMIETANKKVDELMKNIEEDMERTCDVWDAEYFPDRFSINCRTRHDYRDYNFKIVGRDIEYLGMEGDFRD